ncbi:hypothetical protein REPUB_Repub09cG0137800 [Reevesia pubescens]
MIRCALISQKSGIDFVQNCDLPPPLKVFTGNEGGEDEKLKLLKALRLSQTRAREAERKAANLAEEKERISNAFMKDSLHLFGYRQWVRLLEIQVSKLQSQLVKQEKHSQSHHYCDKPEGIESGIGEEMSWLVALVL